MILSPSGVQGEIPARMTKFKAPSRVEFVSSMPRTLIGKVRKKEFRKMV